MARLHLALCQIILLIAALTAFVTATSAEAANSIEIADGLFAYEVDPSTSIGGKWAANISSEDTLVDGCYPHDINNYQKIKLWQNAKLDDHPYYTYITPDGTPYFYSYKGQKCMGSTDSISWTCAPCDNLRWKVIEVTNPGFCYVRFKKGSGYVEPKLGNHIYELYDELSIDAIGCWKDPDAVEPELVPGDPSTTFATMATKRHESGLRQADATTTSSISDTLTIGTLTISEEPAASQTEDPVGCGHERNAMSRRIYFSSGDDRYHTDAPLNGTTGYFGTGAGDLMCQKSTAADNYTSTQCTSCSVLVDHVRSSNPTCDITFAGDMAGGNLTSVKVSKGSGTKPIAVHGYPMQIKCYN